MADQNQWELSRRYLCMHVTAIKTFGNILFWAEGNQVTAYNLNSNQIVASEVIFSSSSIHGIRTDGISKIMFFGSKSLKICSFDPGSSVSFSSLSEEILLPDWIFDAQWLTGNELKTNNNIIIITSHNVITLLNVESKKILKTVQCAENCILYAANVISVLESAIVVAVGTVFRQILLWSPDSSSEINNSKIPFHCLEGHKGVIFSVSYNRHLKLLSSTSDDRSIRLWKVSSSSENNSSLEFWEKSTICPSHILYGHESRVWTSIILENCILSVGEDSCICFWSMNGELLKKKKCHKGGSIWCLETNHLLEKSPGSSICSKYIAITGGSDGGVYCWDVQNSVSSNLVSQVSLHVRSSSEKDFPRTLSIICSGKTRTVMATTDKGWLSFYDIDQSTWKDVYHDPTFVSYCISSVSSAFIALGNLIGDLVLLNSSDLSELPSFDEKKFKKFKIHAGKIFALHWVDEKSKHLLSCGAEGHMILWKVDFQMNEFSITKLHECHLPKCKPHWWSTCAIFIDAMGCLLVGDRGGSISCYSFNDVLDKTVEPNMILKYIHGENGVTDIKEHKSLIYSAGRDGKVLLYSFKEKNLHLLHAIKISHELEWIGKILFHDSDLLLLGFHTKYFIVWSTLLESTVMTVECGGGHRSWDFHLTGSGQATFIAIKKKDIIFTTEDLCFTLNKSILKDGISGKEFCHICYLFTFKSESSSSEPMAVFATGGEDNALRIIGFTDNTAKSQMKSLCSLSGHLSSIRSLAKADMVEENSYLLVSVGGRAQMMIWKIKNVANIECEELAFHILSMDERKHRKTSKTNQDVQVDPQTRLMDVTVKRDNGNLLNGENFIIALACSDSFFRVYNFNASEKLLSLCYNVQLGEHCCLKLSCIQNSTGLFKNLFFVVASTSGNLYFVNHEDLRSLNIVQNAAVDVAFNQKSHLLSQPFKCHIHQSGINAIDIKYISDETWFICTGGDDNALSAMIVKLNSLETNWEIVTEIQVKSAHSSQITGVKFLGRNAIISASIDQRINLWKWCYGDKSLSISLLSSKMSSVPDIANLECWKNRENTWTTIVCGEGIEILRIEDYL